MLNLEAMAIRALIGIAVLGVTALAAYTHGRHTVQGEAATAQLTTALAYAGEIVSRQDTADRLATENTALRAAQAPKDRIITREIIRYETVTPPALRCLLPGTWRLRHDAAATGEPAAAEAGPVASAAADPVTDAAALQTIDSNYAACRNAIDQVDGWQRRYQALEAQP